MVRLSMGLSSTSRRILRQEYCLSLRLSGTDYKETFFLVLLLLLFYFQTEALDIRIFRLIGFFCKEPENNCILVIILLWYKSYDILGK